MISFTSASESFEFPVCRVSTSRISSTESAPEPSASNSMNALLRRSSYADSPAADDGRGGISEVQHCQAVRSSCAVTSESVGFIYSVGLRGP